MIVPLPTLFVVILLVTASIPTSASGSDDSNEVPLVDAGLDRTVQVGDVVLLDGGGSRDPDGSLLSYRWSIETPEGRTIAPENQTAIRTRFETAVTGTYAVTLRATDDEGAVRQDTLYVHVSVRSPPQVRIQGTNRVVQGERVTFRADATDPDGQVVALSWANGDEGVRSSRTIDASPGSYVVLSVTALDDDGLSSTATKRVRVVAANRPPAAAIDGPSTVQRGTSAAFAVQASDPDGSIASVSWGGGESGPKLVRTFDESVGSVVELRAVVVDDDGAQAVATKAVSVLDGERQENHPPRISIRGPSLVTRGDTHQYHLAVSDPDGDRIERVEWTRPTELAERSRSHTFTRKGGTLVRFSAVAEDAEDGVSRDTMHVLITEPPSVTIEGIPDECVLAGSSVTLTAIAESAGSSIAEYTWLIDGVVVGHTSQLTHEFTKNGSTSVTLAVTDDRGQTTTATETVCTTTELENHAPEIRSLSGVWYADSQPYAPSDQGTKRPMNAFETTVESQWPVVHYSGSAYDADGDQLTFRWMYGDGSSGVEVPRPGNDGDTTTRLSEITHSYDKKNPNARTYDYPLTLIVEDEHGATTQATRNVRVHPVVVGNIRTYDLEADSTAVSVGEAITFSVTTNDRNHRRDTVTKAKLRFGDGYTGEVKTNSQSGVATITHSYLNPGVYQVQLSPVFSDMQSRTTGLSETMTITVTRKQYTEYHYREEATRTTVASTSPGPSWSRGEIDHFDSSLDKIREESAIVNSQEARDLERQGFTAYGSWERQVQVGTAFVRDTSSPGSGWTLDRRSVDSVRRQTGWQYETFDNQQYGSEWNLVREVRTTDELSQTTESADRPDGDGWVLAGVAGEERTGWSYEWVDEQSDADTSWRLVDTHDIVIDRHEHGHDHDRWWDDRDVYYTGHDHDKQYECVSWFYATCTEYGWTGHDHDRQRHVEPGRWAGHDHDTWIHEHTDTDYKYQRPEYSTIWKWERTITFYDTDYEYRKPVYADVSRNQYRKPIHETKTYVGYRKRVYNVTTYYEWHQTVVQNHTSLTYPTGNVIWVKKETHSCYTEGTLADQACDSPGTGGPVAAGVGETR